MRPASQKAAPEIGERPSSFKVKVRKIRVYEGMRKTSYTVRWVVNGRTFQETYDGEKLAEGRHAELLSKQRRGEAFDVERGLPVTELARVLAEEADQVQQDSSITWYEHCVSYVERRHKWLSGNSRRSVADTLATVMPALLPHAAGRPSAKALRLALYQWAFDKNRRDREELPPEVEGILEWVARHSPTAESLADPDTVLKALEAIGTTLDGGRAAPNTVARKRGVLSSVLGFGVGTFLDVNPLPAATKRWNPPKGTSVESIDPRVVINPDQAVSLFAAIRTLQPSGPRLVAFFGCLYYAGLRPSEAVELRLENLESLDSEEEATLVLTRSGATAGRTWTDSGNRRDDRGLKWRSDREIRRVPCAPELALLLRAHIEEFGVTDDGRLFRGLYGGDLSDSVYERVLKRARKEAFTAADAASPLARRPYDLRHACLSSWLNEGIDPPQVAAWAGNSVRVLLAVYAKCVSGREAEARKLAARASRPSHGASGG